MAFLIILLLIVLNAYFSLAEIALVTVKQGQLTDAEAQGNHTATQALMLTKDPEVFLSVVQVGITLLSLPEGELCHPPAKGDVLKLRGVTFRVNAADGKHISIEQE